ncbi:hypothetical protein ACFQWB_15760 [Paenibacillus thermoaerophilus]|uniref:Uncharacterized protein n=1 Tax=Paenibacillus thermoaerophilus TaxID=1215385 RepID=A0ABW2V8E6_9BACL|nr:hypothetical protein [Paenibacillus thermoaerophilus]
MKRKPPALQRKQSEQANKKAIIGVASIVGVLLIALIALIVANG